MMRSLFSGVSGLKAHQTGMDVIGNNITNVNTTGFKSSRTTFADMFSQTLTAASSSNGTVGGTNPKQIGLGSVVASIDLLFTDGSTQSTGKNTDMALQGNGLFVVKQGKQTYYTRNGDFQFDEAGNFVNSAGQFVQGWKATDGVLPSNTTKANIGNIQVLAGQPMGAKETSQITYTNNLNASAPYIKSMTVLDGNGNSVRVNGTNTNTWSVGSSQEASTIDNETVTFAGNIQIEDAKGQYKMGGTYNIKGDKLVSVTLADGDVVTNLPDTTTVETDYATGNTLPSTISSISGSSVVYADGAIIANSSNTYTVTLSNNDVVTNSSGTLAGSYTTGAAVTSAIQSVTGRAVAFAGGDSIASSRNTYSSTLSNGDTLTIAAASTTTYTANGALPAALTVKVIAGNTVTLSDGSTITTTNAARYTQGAAVPALNLGAITGTTATTVQSISANNAQTIQDQTKMLTVSLSNGDKVYVPITSTAQYTVGAALTSAITSLDTSAGTHVGFKDGAYIDNSNSTYTVTLNNGDTIKPGSGVSKYAKGSSIASTNAGIGITSIKGQSVTLSNGDILSNNSGTTYKATLATSGDTLTLSASSTTDYTLNSALPSTLTVRSITGNQVKLSDGSVITTSTPANYTLGQTVSATIQSFTGMPSSTVSTIIADAPTTVTEISGAVVSADGTDTFDTKTSGAYIKPSNDLTTSGIALTLADGTDVTVSSSDSTAYKVNGTYSTGDIKSVALNMSDGSTVTESSGSYTNNQSMPVATTMKIFDKLGTEHNITLYFTKTRIGTGTDDANGGDGNTWHVSISPDGGSDYEIEDTSGASNPSKVSVHMPAVDLKFTPDGKVESGNQQQQELTLYNGSESPQTVSIDFSQLTQYAASSTVTDTSDGHSSGNLSSVTIDNQGRIIGTYTNDVQQVEGQVAVAQFSNAAGLTKMGNSLYQESNNSGDANINNNTALGVELTTSALEMSNVDVATEFSNMIITQRGFQSNSKIITVSDEMLETLINMKR